SSRSWRPPMEATDVLSWIRERARTWLPQLLAVGFILLVAVAVLAFRVQGGRNDSLAQTVSAQQSTIDRVGSALGTVEDQLKAHGISPSAPPPAQLITGPPGPGPSDAQVQAAVDVYLAAHPPTG